MIKGYWNSRAVYINHTRLWPKRSQNVFNHSPDGFNWGYGGSGPAQLALTILLYFTNDERQALNLYQSFKWDIIAQLPQTDFELPISKVKEWLKTKGVIKDSKE